MPIEYQSIVPWGRSYSEYVDMFDLSPIELGEKILGCGDGPASFNYKQSIQNKKMVSIDPMYQFSRDEIKNRIDLTYREVIAQTKEHADQFIWEKIKNIDELIQIRMSAMNDFLDDYEKGLKEKRYIFAKLPKLPFQQHEFDLALSSHFLFLYSDHLSLEFHISSIKEMLRVAEEVRIFPVLDLNAKRSGYVKDVIQYFQAKNYRCEEIKVNYEFQKGGNHMLKIRKIP